MVAPNDVIWVPGIEMRCIIFSGLGTSPKQADRIAHVNFSLINVFRYETFEKIPDYFHSPER